MIKNENYITIQGFMVNDLKLKGNELLVYAIIYGFSQTENQNFTGSLQYLEDWTNSSKQGILNCLKSLQEKGYIEKLEKYINGVKFCEYKSLPVVNKVDWGGQKSLPPSSKESLHNNIYNNNIKYIIDYLNSRAGTKYSYTGKEQVKNITARLKEHFTIDDFKVVIDKKVAEWKGTDMAKYIRPETLFGNKFESYLNQQGQNKKTNYLIRNDKNNFDEFFGNLEDVEI